MSLIGRRGISSGRIIVFDNDANRNLHIYELAMTHNINQELSQHITSLFELLSFAMIHKLRNKKDADIVEALLSGVTDILLPQYAIWESPGSFGIPSAEVRPRATKFMVSDHLLEVANCWLLPYENIEVRSESDSIYRDLSLTHVCYDVPIIPTIPRFMEISANSWGFGGVNVLKDFALVEEDKKIRERNDKLIDRMLDIFAGRESLPG